MKFKMKLKINIKNVDKWIKIKKNQSIKKARNRIKIIIISINRKLESNKWYEHTLEVLIILPIKSRYLHNRLFG